MFNLDNVLNTFLARIDTLEAARSLDTIDDYVLAWGNGLAVKFDADGKAQAVSVERASKIVRNDAGKFVYPVVMNGKRETARVYPRRDLITTEIHNIRCMVADIQAAS